jgi:hypothetical protein
MCRVQTSFKCQLCDKKFKGAEYLTKHMHNKHQADVENFRNEEREKVGLEAIACKKNSSKQT